MDRATHWLHEGSVALLTWILLVWGRWHACCGGKRKDFFGIYMELTIKIRAYSATVPVRSCHELLPKYGVSVSCASPFLNFHRYRIQLHSSINYLQTISVRKWSLVCLLSATTRAHWHWHTWSWRRQAHLAWYFDGSGGCKHVISRVLYYFDLVFMGCDVWPMVFTGPGVHRCLWCVTAAKVFMKTLAKWANT